MREERTNGAAARDDEQPYDDSLITCYQCCKTLFAPHWLAIQGGYSHDFRAFQPGPRQLHGNTQRRRQERNADRVSRNRRPTAKKNTLPIL